MRNEITEELKRVPDELRDARRAADEALQRAEKNRPALAWALDVRVVLAAAAIALLTALLARLGGMPFALALLLFLVLFAGLWAGITNVASPRRPTRPLS